MRETGGTAAVVAGHRAPNAERERPLLLDSTLREGEQTPTVGFTIREKLEIAKLLDEFGVDFIEAGHPKVSAEVAAATRAIATEGLSAQVLAHSRALREDIDAARACDADWVGIFFSVRDEALEQRFRRNVDEAIAVITDTVSYAKAHGLGVRYTPEDTVRSDFATVVRVARAAVEAGADRISVADTVGIMTPSRMFDFITRLAAAVPVPLNVHCHNDLGMATANALAAWEAGASLIDVAVNGLGERCGIAPLAATATAVPVAYGVAVPWKLEMLPEISETVARHSGIPVAEQSPITGRHAFTHNAGLHVAAVLIDPNHYESIPAALVGRRRELVVDRFAGLTTIQWKLEHLGLPATEEEARAMLGIVKAQESRWVSDEAFARLWRKVTGRTVPVEARPSVPTALVTVAASGRAAEHAPPTAGASAAPAARHVPAARGPPGPVDSEPLPSSRGPSRRPAAPLPPLAP